jgi:uncharacterized protein
MPKKISAKTLIKEYGLKKHREGGYFKESYRSSGSIARKALPSRYRGDRSFSTAILYLIPAGTISRLHRILSDEIWHFYLGGPLELLQISPDGYAERVILGHEVAAGQKVQHLVPAGYWFGARPMKRSAYSFVGCTVAPGFDFSDFEVADPKALSQSFPALREEILVFGTSKTRRL